MRLIGLQVDAGGGLISGSLRYTHMCFEFLKDDVSSISPNWWSKVIIIAVGHECVLIHILFKTYASIIINTHVTLKPPLCSDEELRLKMSHFQNLLWWLI